MPGPAEGSARQHSSTRAERAVIPGGVAGALVEGAWAAYERAVFDGDTEGLARAERDLNRAEADVALTRGAIVHARFLAFGVESADELGLLERALAGYRRAGERGGEAQALFWIGCFHQVCRGDDDAAVPNLEAARTLAEDAGDRLTRSYALRHLGMADHRAGRLDEARRCLEESTRLRRELDFLPGVAANLVGLAYVAAGQGRLADAQSLAREAAALATEAGARAVVRQAEQALVDLAEGEG